MNHLQRSLRLESDALFMLSVNSGCLCLVRADFFELVDGALVQAMRFGNSSSLMRSLSPTTQCLRDLGEPMDLKYPEAKTLVLSRSPLVQLLLYAVGIHKSPSNCVSANLAIVFVGAPSTRN